jgi:hypothetical protein
MQIGVVGRGQTGVAEKMLSAVRSGFGGHIELGKK